MPFCLSFLPSAQNYTRVTFDVAVALVCLLSLVLCGRSILRGIVLQQVGDFYHKQSMTVMKNRDVVIS